MELHTLPKSQTRPLHQQIEQQQNRLESWRKNHSVKNQRKQPSSNLIEIASSPRDVSFSQSTPPPPPPLGLLVGKSGIYDCETVDLDQLYCGFITTTAENSNPVEKRTNVTDEPSSSRTMPQRPLPPPLPPHPMVLSGPPGYASGGENGLYCVFISPSSTSDSALPNKQDNTSPSTVATATSSVSSHSSDSNISNEGTGSSESEKYIESTSISPNVATPPLNNKPMQSANTEMGFLDNNSSDGRSSTLPQNRLVEAKSKFFVSGICCTTEVPIVRRILRPVQGVSRVDIHLIAKSVTVYHCPKTVTVKQLAQILDDQGFPTKVIHNGATGLDNRGGESMLPFSNADNTATGIDLTQMERSKFVVSTLSVNHEWTRQNVENLLKALRDEYSCNHKVRAIHPNPISKTIKIEHDPKEVPIDNIAISLIARCDVPVVVAVDGASCNLFMPKDERDVESGELTAGSVRASMPHLMEENNLSLSLNVLRCNVTMSGIFWILSLPSHFEVLESLKYFGLVSVAFGLPPILKKAFQTLRRFQFDANCMMTTAAIGAICLQQYDEAASVAFLFSISELLERRASRKAREALKDICDMKPEYANVIHPVTKELMVIPAERVALGSQISVKTGDKIATDGIIIEGHSLVDESSLTGESIPVPKATGDKVKGGTINIGKTQLVVRTTATAEDSAVSRLIQLVEDAQLNRSETEKLIDSFARTYTPTVMMIAVLMAALPLLMRLENSYQWMLNALIIIVIACPCSLTISTPVTYAAGLAATAQKGIVVKGGAKLEAMGSVDKVVFDKTGTLTTGVFSLVHFDVVAPTKTRHELLALLALIEERSSHPVATCLVQAAKNENAHVPRDVIISDHTLLKGEGVSANVSDTTVFVGNQRLFTRLELLDSLSESQKEKTEAWDRTGSMIGFIGTEEEGILGAFCVRDTIRKEAKSVIQGLHDTGIQSMLCTGDSNAVAKAVATETGIAPEYIRSQMLPEEKYRYVETLKTAPKHSCTFWQKQQYVLFCGDGVNDAPALATADIGCSLGEGAAMAMVTSDITLMDSNLSKITEAISIGTKVQKTIKENIILSLLGKLVVVALTFNGEMTLLLAVASDVGIMLLVTLNGMKVLSSSQEGPAQGQANDKRIEKWTEMNPLLSNADGVDEIV